MSKAFDKVDHTLLLEKLYHFNISGNLHNLFRLYLRGRKQRATVLGAASQDLEVTSGVPQGSLLGPLLFLIYINSLPDAVTSSTVACFADDTKVVKRIDSPADCAALQLDLTSLVSWSIFW